MQTTELYISDEKSSIHIDFVHHYLSEESYWAKGIPRELVIKSIEHSLCFSVFLHEQQIGFARVISDQATFAYLCDVFIDEAFRGKGYSKQLMHFIMNYPALQTVRVFALGTLDAHGLYAQFGFLPLATPERRMEIRKSNPYE